MFLALVFGFFFDLDFLFFGFLTFFFFFDF